MSLTYRAIANVTVTGSPSDISITNIPQTYTDLIILVSAIARTTANPNALVMNFNGYSATSLSFRYIRANGSAASSGNSTGSVVVGDLTNITSTYNSVSIYIPNYASSGAKTLSSDSVSENNGTTAYSALWANAFTVASGITSIQFGDGSAGGGLGVGSQVWLYGIKNS